MKNSFSKKYTSFLAVFSLSLLLGVFGLSNVALARPGAPMPIASPAVDVVVSSGNIFEKDYQDGDLVRYFGEDRIYIIENGDLRAIRTLEELAKYAGEEILNINRDGSIYSPEQEVLGEKKYADGTLLRYHGEDQIYIMAFGQMTPIKHIQLLEKYAGQEIINISRPGEVLGEKLYADGTLLRGSDMKIYAVVDGNLKHLNTLDKLREYTGVEILDVLDSVISDWR